MTFNFLETRLEDRGIPVPVISINGRRMDRATLNRCLGTASNTVLPIPQDQGNTVAAQAEFQLPEGP